MTPNDHMSHDLSYFSGPRTSGAADRKEGIKRRARDRRVDKCDMCNCLLIGNKCRE